MKLLSEISYSAVLLLALVSFSGAAQAGKGEDKVTEQEKVLFDLELKAQEAQIDAYNAVVDLIKEKDSNASGSERIQLANGLVKYSNDGVTEQVENRNALISRLTEDVSSEDERKAIVKTVKRFFKRSREQRNIHALTSLLKKRTQDIWTELRGTKFAEQQFKRLIDETDKLKAHRDLRRSSKPLDAEFKASRQKIDQRFATVGKQFEKRIGEAQRVVQASSTKGEKAKRQARARK